MEQNEIVKVCKKHGELTKEKASKNGCKYCRKNIARNNYLKNKLKILSRQKNNPNRLLNKRKSYHANKEKHVEKERERGKHYRLKHGESINAKKRIKRCLETENLSNTYVKKILCKGTSLSCKDIPEGLIQLKRVIVANNRLIRGIKGGSKISKLNQKLLDSLLNGDKK